MADQRNWSGLLRGGPPGGSIEGPIARGTRVSPGYQPTPNSEPLGAETGAPPRVRYFSMQVPPQRLAAVVVVPETRDNRVATLTAPNVGFTVYVGDAGVSPKNGMALPAGQAFDLLVVGFQDVYAVTDAPVFLTLQVQISPVLLAERERRL